MSYSYHFKSFADHAWLNAASEGPLPLVSAEALQEAIHWKSLPYLLDIPKFIEVPLRLKKSIGRLLKVSHNDIILGNSASYGLHLLANGMPWREGDEILVMQNDFPTDIMPWLALEDQGVKVIQMPLTQFVIQPEEVLACITKRTRLLCLPHVHTFSGVTLEVPKIAKICSDHNIPFVLNVSQSAGTQLLDIPALGVDAVVCAGYKWLCGPYGTGFCWMRPELCQSLKLNSAYWISLLSEKDLSSEGVLERKISTSARRFDVFGTANFFNFVPFRQSLDFLLEQGIDKIESYNQSLINQLIQGLDRKQFDIVSPLVNPERSNLVVISHRNPDQNESVHKGLLDKNIHTALWKNKIRISPHLFNTSKDISRFLEVCNDLS